MNAPFDALTRYVQIRQGAIAVTSDERVYLVRGGRAVELVQVAHALAATDEDPAGVECGAVSQLGDGS